MSSVTKFKKPKKRPPTRKKEKVETSVENEKESDTLDSGMSDELETARMLRKSRERKQGVTARVQHDDSGTRFRISSKKDRLVDTFTEGKERKEKDVIRSEMEKYINEKLQVEKQKWQDAALREVAGGGGVAPAPVLPDHDAEQKALAAAAHKLEDSSLFEGLRPVNEEEEEQVEAPTAISLSGVEEVVLPIEYRLKNIIQTETALKEMELYGQKRIARPNPKSAPANFNFQYAANTSYHANASRKRKADLKTVEQKEAEEKKRITSTDDQTMKKFKQHFRKRR